MALKDILVQLQADPRSDVRLQIAAGLAQRSGAFLRGLFVIEIPEVDYLYGAGLPMAGIGPDQMVNFVIADFRAAAEPVEKAFRETLRAHDLQGEWQLLEGYAAETLCSAARCADLVVVGQPNEPRRHNGGNRVTVETVMLSSGRPVLTIPFAGEFPQPTDHILIAWNASREATRAVHDAMPLLRQANKVTILAILSHGVVDAEEAAAPGPDLAAHLARHGVRAETMRTVAAEISDGDALLSFASDVSASMIVAGGYGHSRAREIIFGGVTRTLLTEMTVPVLFAH